MLSSSTLLSSRVKIGLVALIMLACFIKDSSAIMCYHCNSEYDPRCGDPFNSYSLGVVNCSVTPRPEHITEEPTLCRKIMQKVYGEIRVVRGCGYVVDERDNKQCMKRSGTHDVFATYCACTQDLCNSAPKRVGFVSVVLALAVALGVTRLA